MKKTRLLLILSFVCILGFMFFMPFGSKLKAAEKPSLSIKSYTLHLKEKGYSIQLKNVASGAKIKYSSSDKKVVKIKNSKVVPVGEGEALVTVKVTQNGKTYKLKMSFTVVEAEKKKKNYDALAKSTVKRLKDEAEHYELRIPEGNEGFISSSRQVLESIYEYAWKYTSAVYNMNIKDYSFLRSESEYIDLIPILDSLTFTEPKEYNNCVCIMVTIASKNYYSDEAAVYYAINSGDSSLLTSEERQLYNKVVGLAADLKGSSEYDTVKNIHDYIVLNTAYPSSWSGEGVHTLNYAINKGECVCDGYSKMFLFLCRAAGIDCILVRGEATNSLGKTDSHAWNKVKIDGKWYAIDVTWDDPYPDEPGKIKYHYFLIKDSDIATNHTWDNKGLPKANFSDLGVIYEKYKNVRKFTKANEAIQYMKNTVAEAYSSKGFTCVMEFLDNTGDSVLQAVKNLTSEYHSSYNCGWSYKTESAGIYGTYYYVKIYR